MKVICKLPNAAEVINGVKFAEHKLGMISEEIAEEVGEHFLKIPGYVRVGSPTKATTTETAAEPATTAAATGDATTAATDPASTDAAGPSDAAK